MLNESAPAGKELKYALVERERRFILAGPSSESSTRDVRIIDRYLTGTRIRLRQQIEGNSDGAEVVYKLTQKVPGIAGGPGLITTMYLSEAEYQILSRLPAGVLRKLRHRFPGFGVDEFQGVLSGLYLAEAEFATDEESVKFSPPAFVVAEVTGDLRFTGGHLVTATREEINAALTEFGLTFPSSG